MNDTVELIDLGDATVETRQIEYGPLRDNELDPPEGLKEG